MTIGSAGPTGGNQQRVATATGRSSIGFVPPPITSNTRGEEPLPELPPAEREAIIADQLRRAEGHLATTTQYFRDHYGRDSWNDAGAGVDLVVMPDKQNAYADVLNGQILLGRLGNRWLTDELFVVAHEYTHLVAGSEVGRRGVEKVQDWGLEQWRTYERLGHLLYQENLPANHPRVKKAFADYYRLGGLIAQYPAIEEAMGDIFGAALTHSWEAVGLRNAATERNVTTHMRNYGGARDPQPEPHRASGIVSNAAVDVQRAIGWDKTARIFYEVINDPRLDAAGTFHKVGTLAQEHAGKLYGSAAAKTVHRAFRANGVKVPLPMSGQAAGQPAGHEIRAQHERSA